MSIPSFARSFLAAALVLASWSALAQYPTRPVRLVVPYAPGGSSDIVGRLFADKLEKRLGQQVFIENVGGAGGTLGAQRVAAAAPDGYTLLIGAGSELLIRGLLQPTPYDGMRDFQPIAMIGTGPMALIGKAGLPETSLPALVEAVKRRPEVYSYGSPGSGTFMHLVGEAVKFKTGAAIPHVAYRGAGPLMTDIVGAHVDLGVVSLVSALPYIQSGQAKAYGVTSRARVSFAPDIPALAEFPALSGFELELWIGLFGPSQLPQDVAAKLREAALATLDDPELVRKLAEQAIVARKLSGPELSAFLETEREKYRAIIQQSNIKVE